MSANQAAEGAYRHGLIGPSNAQPLPLVHQAVVVAKAASVLLARPRRGPFP